MKRQTAEATWKALLRCWSRLYLGPPDYLRIDQGSNFVAREFLESAEADGITVLQAPIESPSTMSHVERYHAPLRAAYKKIRDSLPRLESDEDCLQLAVKAVNDTIGPEGLCPTLLVFGAIPRPARKTPAPQQLERAKAIDEAMNAVGKEQAKQRVAFGLRHFGTPVGREKSYQLQKLPAGFPVYVYRTFCKQWEGPFPIIQTDGETAVIQLPSGRKFFRTNVVKPRVESMFPFPGCSSNSDVSNSDAASFEEQALTAMLVK